MELHQRFLNGLAEYGMTEEDIKKWRWCGSSVNPDGYWAECFPNQLPPDPVTKCICGQSILVQHWITDGNEFLVIGSECKNKFMVFGGKTCAMCGEPHKNRKDNHCKECRGLIKQQEKEKIEKMRIEREIQEKWNKKHLCGCGRTMNMNGTDFKQCWSCFQKRKVTPLGMSYPTCYPTSNFTR
jgi:hypothetical protein